MWAFMLMRFADEYERVDGFILQKSVKAHAGTARRKATKIETVLISRRKEEGHREETDINRNLLQEQETNQTNKEETFLQIKRRKIRD